MPTLFFIRHAESEANSKRILASQLSYPLTDEGKADAGLIASELKEKVNIHRIISSPLIRAVQTAEAFGKVYDLEIESDERLVEQHLGSFSGMTYDEVKHHPRYESDTQKRWNWIPEGGGESYSQVAERVNSFLKSMENLPEDLNILIITHAVTFRLIEAVLKDTLPEYPTSFPNNGEIRKVRLGLVGSVHEIDSLMLGNSEMFAHNP